MSALLLLPTELWQRIWRLHFRGMNICYGFRSEYDGDNFRNDSSPVRIFLVSRQIYAESRKGFFHESRINLEGLINPAYGLWSLQIVDSHMIQHANIKTLFYKEDGVPTHAMPNLKSLCYNHGLGMIVLREEDYAYERFHRKAEDIVNVKLATLVTEAVPNDPNNRIRQLINKWSASNKSYALIPSFPLSIGDPGNLSTRKRLVAVVSQGTFLRYTLGLMCLCRTRSSISTPARSRSTIARTTRLSTTL